MPHRCALPVKPAQTVALLCLTGWRLTTDGAFVCVCVCASMCECVSKAERVSAKLAKENVSKLLDLASYLLPQELLS